MIRTDGVVSVVRVVVVATRVATREAVSARSAKQTPTPEQRQESNAEAAVHEDVRPKNGERLERRADVGYRPEQRDREFREHILERLREERGQL